MLTPEGAAVKFPLTTALYGVTVSPLLQVDKLRPQRNDLPKTYS